MFSDNPAYRAYSEHLWQLHALDASGQAESKEADEIHEAMNDEWSKLSPAERRRIAGLSHDFFSLHGDEPQLEGGPPPQEAFARFNDAFTRADSESALESLRFSHDLLPPQLLAYMRGRCWRRLGDPLAATRFFARAAELEPTNPNFAMLALESLAAAGKREPAIEQARRHIDDPQAHARVQIQSARILFDETRELSADQARPHLQTIVAVLQGAIDRESQLPAAERVQSLVLAARINLASAQERLGELERARAAYDDAIAQHPESGEALVARMLFRMRHEADPPIDDFELVVRRGTGPVYPYLFLAERSLIERRYRACVELCERALGRTDRSDVRANLIEWAAIARLSLGASLAVVREHFQVARALDPLNDRIRRNDEAFETFARGAASAASGNVFDLHPSLTAEAAAHELGQLPTAA